MKKYSNLNLTINLENLKKVQDSLVNRVPSNQLSLLFENNKETEEVNTLQSINPKNLNSVISTFLGMIKESSEALSEFETDISDLDHNYTRKQIRNMYYEVTDNMKADFFENIKDQKEYFEQPVKEYYEKTINKIIKNFKSDQIGLNFLSSLWEKIYSEEIEKNYIQNETKDRIKSLYADSYEKSKSLKEEYISNDVMIEYLEENLDEIIENIVVDVVEFIDYYSMRQINKDLPKNLLKYIDDSFDKDEVIDYYVDSNYKTLEEEFLNDQEDDYRHKIREADKNLQEIMNLNIPIRGQHHQFAAYDGPLEYLSDLNKKLDITYNLNENIDDLKDWNEVDLEDFTKIAKVLSDLNYLKGANQAAISIFSHIDFIEKIVDSDRGLKLLFSNKIEELELPPYYINNQISSYNEKNANLFSEYKMTEEERIRKNEENRLRKEEQQREERAYRERAYREMEAEKARISRLQGEEKAKAQEELKLKRKLESVEKREVGMFEGESNSKKEELERMKQYEIAKKPFEFSHSFKAKNFPGQAVFKDLERNMSPFIISFYPKENDKLPKEVLRKMQLHTLEEGPEGTLPGMGWVGGFYSKYKNSIYIVEVQSDIMQRSKFMKDPAKSIEQKTQEINKLSNIINELTNKNQNFQKQLESKNTEENPKSLEKIKLIQDTISRTPKTDPNLEKMTQELNKAKIEMGQILTPKKIQQINETILSNNKNIENYKNEIIRLQKEIESDKGFEKEIGLEKIFHKPELHEYKSFVEQYLKDWLGVFFNTAMRYAVQYKLDKVYIVTPESLLRRWSSYTGSETKTLFDRIYTKWAEFYKAEKQGDWFVIDLKGDIKVANNWYKVIKRN